MSIASQENDPSRSGLALGTLGLVAAVVLAALNLRPAIVAVGPLTSDIKADTGLSSTATSLLTAVPLLCLGAFAAAAAPLARRLGFERTVLLAVVAIFVGIALRLFTPIPALFAGSILAGSGIAIANVLVPALIKRDFPLRIGPMMAIYSVALQAGATLASGMTVPLGRALDVGWRPALAIWAVPAAFAALAWLPMIRRPRPDAASTSQRHSVWQSGLGWAAAAFIGIQSGVYFSLTAWLPSMLIDDGLGKTEAGIILSAVGLFGILGGLPMPLLAARMRHQRWLVAVVIAVFLIGLVGLMVAPAPLALLWAVLLGVGQGGGLSLALTLFTLRSRTAAGAAQLSGMAQSAGYSIAAVAPLMVGVVHDLSGNWTVPVIVLLVALVPMAAAGWQVARPRFLEDEAAVTSQRARDPR